MIGETYEFDDETCRCAASSDTPTTAEKCQLADLEKPFVSPVDDSECVSRETYFAFYEHGLGEDCKFENGGGDDGPREPQYCPPGFIYDMEFCSCKPTDECAIECEFP